MAEACYHKMDNRILFKCNVLCSSRNLQNNMLKYRITQNFVVEKYRRILPNICLAEKTSRDVYIEQHCKTLTFCTIR